MTGNLFNNTFPKVSGTCTFIFGASPTGWNEKTNFPSFYIALDLQKTIAILLNVNFAIFNSTYMNTATTT